MQSQIYIATRTSQLAKIMTNEVIDKLKPTTPSHTYLMREVQTNNRAFVDTKLGIKGIFTNALDACVRDGLATFAVHSAKDLPSKLHADMTIAAYLERKTPEDALISKNHLPLEKLPDGATIGTASQRRKMMVSALRPDLQVIPFRGNIDTRLSNANQFDAIILALSGLERLNLAHHVTQKLDPKTFIPAAGQGAIAITCLKSDRSTIERLKPLNHEITANCVNIERNVCAQLDLSCHDPIGVYVTQDEKNYNLNIHVLKYDTTWSGSFSSPINQGTQTIADMAVQAVKKNVV